MKKRDYSTLKQASEYYKKRFAKGKELVSRDETSLLGKWIKEKTKRNQPLIFLDIGTGTGRAVNELLKHHPKTIYASDNSPAMLDYFKKLFSKELDKGLIKLIKAPSDKINLPDGSIDIATSFHLFKHLPNIQPTLNEINRILKPEGYFIFDVLNKNSLVKFNLGTCYALTEKEITQKIKGSGFRIKNLEFLHPLGETVYGCFGGKLAFIVKYIDRIISTILPKLGTKMFVLVKKE